MDKNKYIIVFIFTIFCLSFVGIANAVDGAYEEKEIEEQVETYRGQVVDITETEPPSDERDFTERIQVLKVQMTSGPYEGEIIEIDNPISGDDFYDLQVSKGDRLLIRAEISGDEISNLYIQDFGRDTYIYYTVGAFALALLVVGGLKGFKTLVTLGITLFIIFRVMMPLVAEGYNPLWLGVLLASLVALISLIIIGGFNKKSIVAIIGTIGGVIAAGILALIVGEAASLTGFSSEGAQLLQYTDIGDIDVRGLLFAGIIIGALGAVMDIGMSISSACFEMKEINPRIKGEELFRAGLNVGRDIMGTMSNTLILAYTGSAMPLLLLFMAQDMGFTEIINLDIIATEVIRAIAGSMGLLVAIPITAVTAKFFYGHKK